MVKFSNTDKKRINQAIQLKNQEKYEQAIQLLKDLLPKYKDSPALYGLIASNYFLQKNYNDAAVFFDKTVILSPRSESVSLGLFHSLTELCYNDLAFQEMDRFLSKNEPNYYKILIAELYKGISIEDFNEEQIEIISKYYKCYVDN